MIQVFGTAKCKGTREAQRFFADRSIKIQMIELQEKNLSKGELSSVAKAVGGVRALYDEASPRVKERGLQHLAPNDERITELLLGDPRLLRTPIVRDGKEAAVGSAPATWRVFAERAKKG